METEDPGEVGIDSNSNMTGKLESIEADSGDGVLEEVVEEGIIMQNVDNQMVMVSGGEMGQQHLVISTDGNQLAPGTQVIQIQDGSILVNTMKTEPEDLSVADERGRMLRLPSNRQINLEAGAQAIQASAAACVQNVMRKMKETDDGIILSDPVNSLTDNDGGNHIVIEESLHDSMLESPAKRSRTNNNSGNFKISIAKQYTPYGFHATLDAPTAQWVRKDEDRCTYMNKGQFYGLTLEYRSGASEPFLESHLTCAKSVVMLVFRDAKNPDDEVNAWEFWHSRQPTGKQRIIEAETNNINPDQCGISEIQDMAYNAITVFWNPLDKPAFLSLAVQCLSTDFSVQKGIKGMPMHLQVDTYLNSSGDDDYDIVHRSYCQVKVFCDKGAERKFRQEERRAARKVAVGGQRVLEMYHQPQERSEFYSMVDLTRVPVLFTPAHMDATSSTTPPLVTALTSTHSPNLSLLKTGSTTVIPEPTRRRKSFPPPESRMVVYVRQENEEIYTPLHLVPPNVQGLARAIESKYNVSAAAIRYLYRRNAKGITAKLDDDLLKFYCNEDTFLMQVTAIELEGMAGQDSIMYDITLCEIND